MNSWPTNELQFGIPNEALKNQNPQKLPHLDRPRPQSCCPPRRQGAKKVSNGSRSLAPPKHGFAWQDIFNSSA